MVTLTSFCYFLIIFYSHTGIINDAAGLVAHSTPYTGAELDLDDDANGSDDDDMNTCLMDIEFAQMMKQRMTTDGRVWGLGEGEVFMNFF